MQKLKGNRWTVSKKKDKRKVVFWGNSFDKNLATTSRRLWEFGSKGYGLNKEWTINGC